MDSPFISSLFRTLFHRRACVRPLSSTLNGFTQRRGLASKTGNRELAWHPRNPYSVQDMSEEFARYPMVTAQMLASRRERPKRVKMLAREFFDDSLYNPHYGYFSKQAVIFSSGEPFNFPAMRDEIEFHKVFADRYTSFEDALDKEQPTDARQLWHTPTEIFKPYYGEAIARYLVTNYKLSLFPYNDLIIYEMGAGNGTMMMNILDYIRETDPDVYQRTRYKVIEISAQLAGAQREKAASGGHEEKIEIVNKSIFEWDTYVPNPCFFLALEVFDNFSHDIIRYDPETERPLQGVVLIDSKGDFHEFYVPDLDRIASRFLSVRKRVVRPGFDHPLNTPKFIRRLRSQLPFAPNLSTPEYIPTRMIEFFDILREWFPSHRLVMSDFHWLPDTVEGVNAPVVQTRYNRTTVPVSTPFVQQGYFDILFPTDFEVVEDMYQALTGKLTRVMKHEGFMRQWANLVETETISGDNPMLSYYQNASVMSSV